MSARYQVVAPAVVLALPGGGERYLYRGAVVESSAVAEKSLKHALDLGLVSALPEPDPEPASEPVPVSEPAPEAEAGGEGGPATVRRSSRSKTE